MTKFFTITVFLLGATFLMISKGFAQPQSAGSVRGNDSMHTAPVPGLNSKNDPRLTDSAKTKALVPKRAAMLSALVPGLGQHYNHDYWKMGLIYAGLGTAVYFFQDNYRNYNKYRSIYAGRTNVNNTHYSDEYTGIYSDDQIQQLQKYYKRNLDMTVLLTAVGYLAQLAEALASNHMKGFDISEDLSMKIKPSVIMTPDGPSAGMGLVFNFK